jgi:hypothetical protein
VPLAVVICERHGWWTSIADWDRRPGSGRWDGQGGGWRGWFQPIQAVRSDVMGLQYWWHVCDVCWVCVWCGGGGGGGEVLTQAWQMCTLADVLEGLPLPNSAGSMCHHQIE